MTEKRILIEGEQCSFDDCDRVAEGIYCGSYTSLNAFCEVHGEMVQDEGCVQYRQTCPNCGCGFGV